MANAFVPQVGHFVSYLAATVGDTKPRWRASKITSITDATHLVLAIVNNDGTRVALNGGSAVARRTSSTQTNVWRPY